MKSVAELEAIRLRTLSQVNLRRESEGTRVAVAMGTCGIAAGARPVVTAFMEEVAKQNLNGVVVAQTGCVGNCDKEPVVVVTCPGKEKVTYVNVKPEMVSRIVTEHLVNGQPVKEYTLG